MTTADPITLDPSVVENRRALEALRNGVPNQAAIRALGCSQEVLEREFSIRSSRVAADVRLNHPEEGILVAGDFGTGKSHLLGYLADLARGQRIVCSRVVVSKETPFYDVGKVFRAAIETAVLPDARGPAMQEISAVLDKRSPRYAELYSWASSHSDLWPGFAATLRVWENPPEDEAGSKIVDFWSGEQLPIADLRRWLRKMGLLAAFPAIRQLKLAERFPQQLLFAAQLFQAAGYQGWAVLVDEAEMIGHYSALQRARSYSELARWLGLSEAGSVPGVLAVAAITEDFDTSVLEGKNDWEQAGARLRDRDDEIGIRTHRRGTRREFRTLVSGPWWQPLTVPRASWWTRFRRRPLTPEPALRRQPHLATPTPVAARAIVAADPSPADWLFHALRSDKTVAVNVMEPPGCQRSRHTRSTHEPGTGTGIRQPSGDDSAGPSLADALRLILMPPLERLLPGADAIIEWPANLYPYQREGVLALVERERVLLADDMGLGKTIQVAAAIRIMAIRRDLQSTLLLVPASLIDQWRRELARWAPELRVMPVRGRPAERAWQWRAEAHVHLVSYETFRGDAATTASIPRSRHWDLVVLDEAQKIKNRDTEGSRLAKSLSRKRSWALTGTPLETSVEDLASILEFVDHDPGGGPRRLAPGAALLELHQRLQIRRRKADVLKDLPPKQVVSLTIDLSPQQRHAYDLAEHHGIVHLRSLGATVRVQHVLELILRLKQICNADPASGESAKLDDIAERLAVLAAEGHRAFVFSQFTDEAHGVARAAQRLAEFDPLTYIGGMSSAQRDEVIQRFRSDARHRALILSLRAGGVGLNLQEASYVFHLDRWWNSATERQAEDRSHRIGQTVPVTVFRYTCEGTIEERIDRILAERQQLFDEVIDDVSVDIASHLNQEQLFGLFGLDPPEGSARRSANTGLDLEQRCDAILSRRGWSVEHTPRSHDGGVDLIARKVDEVGIEQTLYVQCKDHARPVSVEAVRELLGVLPPEASVQGLLVSTGGFTAEATRLARSRSLHTWDAADLARLEP